MGTALPLAGGERPPPRVLLLDEVDSLVGDTLISLLRQIRAGYPDVSRPSPAGAHVRVWDVWDYCIRDGDNQTITGGSAFNIKSESLQLGNFSHEEVTVFYAQHTEATRQIFEAKVIIMSLSRPQTSPGWSIPWATKPALGPKRHATAPSRFLRP